MYWFWCDSGDVLSQLIGLNLALDFVFLGNSFAV